MDSGNAQSITMPHAPAAVLRDERLVLVKRYLVSLEQPTNLTALQFKQFIKVASRFFVLNDELWRKQQAARRAASEGRHARVQVDASEECA